jgi:hypothetical protein
LWVLVHCIASLCVFGGLGIEESIAFKWNILGRYYNVSMIAMSGSISSGGNISESIILSMIFWLGRLIFFGRVVVMWSWPLIWLALLYSAVFWEEASERL